MAEQGNVKVDRRGTIWDWPASVVLIGIALWFYVALGGGTPGAFVYLVMAFGAVAWLIRRGAFSPRR